MVRIGHEALKIVLTEGCPAHPQLASKGHHRRWAYSFLLVFLFVYLQSKDLPNVCASELMEDRVRNERDTLLTVSLVVQGAW